MITLAIMADDEHWATVAVAIRLARRQYGRVSPLGRNVAHAFSETAVTEFIGTTKKFYRIIGVIRS